MKAEKFTEAGRHWMFQITEKENKEILDMLEKFTGERLAYGEYRIVVGGKKIDGKLVKGLIKRVECTRSVEVHVNTPNSGTNNKQAGDKPEGD